MDDNTNNPDEKKSLKDDFDESADLDDSKAKFLNGKKGLDESHDVVVEVGSSSEDSFTGLGKEELMKYAKDPFWVRTRMILFALFWLAWIAMLVSAIVIIILAPKCPERPNLKWFETDTVYQINPKSFKDTSGKDATDAGAGVGDITGIAGNIDYLQTSLGVNAFWINSIYKSGGLYDGNDVEDHKKVDEIYGSMADLVNLRKSSKKKGMRMVLDFIPNHTGKKHEWFTKSEAKDADYADFYIWANGAGNNTKPPNNWQTVYGTPAWTLSATRNQWYYHSYLPEYPDLNLANEDVLKQLDGVLRFWLDKGIDGFAVQGLQRLVEANDTSKNEATDGEHTVDQAGNLDLVKRWRAIINSYSDKPGRERALMASVIINGNNTKDYHKAGIQIVLSDSLIGIDFSACDQACLKDKLEKAVSGRWTGWMVDNENSPRFGSSVDQKNQKALQALHMLLPGTAVVYYGDEIAMEDGVVAADKAKDILTTELGISGRDVHRTPMLWNSNENAGFCAAGLTPWLPVNADYTGTNVEFNNAHMVGYTMLNSFKDLVQLRENEAFQFGNFEVNVEQDALYFTREATGFTSYLVVINRGAQMAGFKGKADSMTLVYSSEGDDDVGQVFDTKSANIGFHSDTVYVFSY